MLILLACYKHYNQIGMALKHFWIYRALVFSTSEAVIQFSSLWDLGPCSTQNRGSSAIKARVFSQPSYETNFLIRMKSIKFLLFQKNAIFVDFRFKDRWSVFEKFFEEGWFFFNPLPLFWILILLLWFLLIAINGSNLSHWMVKLYLIVLHLWL